LALSRPESHLKILPRLANSALTTNLLPLAIFDSKRKNSANINLRWLGRPSELLNQHFHLH